MQNTQKSLRTFVLHEGKIIEFRTLLHFLGNNRYST